MCTIRLIAQTGEERTLKYELFNYQEEAASNISKRLAKAARDYDENPDDLTAVVLAAPTGAGKTVIATSVIEASLDGDESALGIDDATFLWVTDDPSLNRQTLNKMMASSSALTLDRLITIENDFDREVFEPGRVYFLNIQKLSSSAALSRSKTDGHYYSLWETIANTILKRPHGFVVVVDEAHRGMATARKTRETIVAQIIGGGGTGRPPVPVVWGISATPRKFLSAMSELGRTTRSHIIRIENVRASGLLKDQIILGHTRGVDADESTLVRHAVRRVREYDRKWSSYIASTGEPLVRPALVVQVADKPTDRELGDLVGTILEEWPDANAESIVHTFADHSRVDVGGRQIAWCPPEDIQDRADIRVVLCKTSITTGWDCPRAEVLLSLRVAKDTDLITQVMGRMVRTPLARRIQTDEDLNAVHCVLPKFDQTSVDAIAERFRAGDDETLASGAAVVINPVELTRNPQLIRALQFPPAPGRRDEDADRDERQSAKSWLISDSRSVFDVVASLPSYTIPRRALRSPITRLRSLAMLLATELDGHALQPRAQAQATNALIQVIELHRANLADSGELASLLERTASTRLFERAVGFARPDVTAIDTETLIQLDSRGISILMDRVRSVLPQGLANDYVNRLAQTDDDVPQAMITAIAVGSDPRLPSQLDARASALVEEWFAAYGSAITRLPAGEQERFDRIKQEVERPLPTTITLPTQRTEDAEGTSWERHLLSDRDGRYRMSLRDWEEHVLRAELDAGALAWYRNPPIGRASLQVPYKTARGIAGLAPDFIFIACIGGNLVADLIDPHGVHLADAVPKLQGLAAYAAKHAASYHRIQSVAKIDGDYLMLNHLDKTAREAIEGFSDTDASGLFRQHGVEY